MILLNFQTAEGLRLGILQDGFVIDTGESGQRLGIEAPATMAELTGSTRRGLGKLESLAAVVPDGEKRNLGELEIGPAVPAISSSMTCMILAPSGYQEPPDGPETMRTN